VTQTMFVYKWAQFRRWAGPRSAQRRSQFGEFRTTTHRITCAKTQKGFSRRATPWEFVEFC